MTAFAHDPLDSDVPDVSLLTVSEVAAALRVSKMTVYRLIQADSLAAIRVGRSVRVSAASLRAFFATTAPEKTEPVVRITVVRGGNATRPPA